MNNKLVIGGVVAVLIILAGFFLLTSKATAPENGIKADVQRKTVTEGAFAPTNNQTETGSGSFRTLLSLGKNLSCTVSYTSTDSDNAGTYNGTVYVAGQKMRMEFTTSVEGIAMKSNVINDGTEGYMWGTGPQGSMAIKFKADPSQTETQKQNEFSLDQNVNYNCKNWSVDESLFVPPADIEFLDMSDMMKQVMPQGTEGMRSAQCASCNQIGDKTAKAQCLEALSCN
jgi:hypothetical protein